jgi:branched-chain amino acid transport system permease protein
MTTWLFFAALGVGTGALYAAFAMSVVVSYRGSGFVNLSVGALAMIPAMTFAELRTSGDLVLPVVVLPSRFALGEPMDVVPAIAIALAIGLALAAFVYRVVVRPLRAAPPVTALVATVGVTLVLQALAVKRFGNVNLRAPPMLPDRAISVLGRPYPVDRLWLLATVLMLTVVVVVTYRATRFGLATRAAFLNEKGAVLLGLEPARLGLYNWMFASALAAVVGILASSLGGVSPFNFSLYVVPALGAALAARLRSIPVAVLTAVAIGGFEAVAVHVVAQEQVPRFLLGGFSSMVPFVVIVGALFVFGSALPNRAAIAEQAHVPVLTERAHRWHWAAVIAGAAVLLSSDDPTVRLATLQTLFVTTLLLSIVVLTGFVGQVSLAQLSFAGFSAFMLSRFDSIAPFPVGPLLAVAATTVVGTLVSIPALRVRGVQFAIVTYSIAVVFDETLFRSPSFVGRGGIAEVEQPRLFGIDLGIFGTGQFPERRFGYVMLAATACCAAIVVGLRSGSVGRRMLVVRANERAAAASGVDVARTKVLAAAIASFVAGVAGVMFAYKSVSFNGGGLEAQDGLEMVALGYLGGIGSIAGAVIGGVLAPSGVFVVGVLGGGSSVDQFLLTGLGLVLVAVRFPGGLAGTWRTYRHVVRPGGRRAAADPDDDHLLDELKLVDPVEFARARSESPAGPDDRMWRPP